MGADWRSVQGWWQKAAAQTDRQNRGKCRRRAASSNGALTPLEAITAPPSAAPAAMPATSAAVIQRERFGLAARRDATADECILAGEQRRDRQTRQQAANGSDGDRTREDQRHAERDVKHQQHAVARHERRAPNTQAVPEAADHASTLHNASSTPDADRDPACNASEGSPTSIAPIPKPMSAIGPSSARSPPSPAPPLLARRGPRLE